nr:UDP-N-acetylmuramoyl-tripeptide--D-alanyl-D-alanine ligase [candidate division Zixibacteria bacterium]
MDFKTLAKECRGELVNDRFAAAVFEGISIDSRTIKSSQLFTAIKGEHNDGHDYIDQVLGRNCGGLLVNNHYSAIAELKDRIPLVAVADTHRALMILAENYRSRIEADIIAVTGSNGKTTTKEYIYGMLKSRREKTYRSPGNLNNLYGLPLAIFGIPSDSRYGVFELGISIPGEMTRLAQMIKPDVALITNVGPTHLETLGTIAGVAEAKCGLIDRMPPDKPAVVNADDSVLVNAAGKRKHRLVTFGVKNRADFTARLAGVSSDGFPLVVIDGREIRLNLFGEHQVYNILAAYAVCRTLEVDLTPEDLNNVEYDFAPYRGQIENTHGLITIADCYNANPVSLESGLRSFKNYLGHGSLAGRRSVAVVGDMLELGPESPIYHAAIGNLLAELDFERVLAVGRLSVDMVQAATAAGFEKKKISHFDNTEQAGEALISDIKRGDILYFKASRGIGLEKILTLLKGTALRQN